jgi:hypothetical protein
MAFLAPAAAAAGTAGAVSATAGAAALAKGAALAGGASGALGAGLSAGTALGGASMAAMPALSYAGANLAAPGILGALPSAVAPTAGLFAKAMPALGGLPSLAPAAAQAAPGIFSQAAPALGGLKSFAPLAQTTPGFKSLAMANAPLTAPSSFGAVNQAMGMGTAPLTTNLPTISKASYLTQGAKSMTDLPSVQNYLTQMPGEASRFGLKMPTTGAETAGLRLSPETAQSMLTPRGSPIIKGDNFLSNFGNLISNPSLDAAGDYVKEHPLATAGMGLGAMQLLGGKPKPPPAQDLGSIRPYDFERTQNPEAYAVSPIDDTSERMYFNSRFVPLEPYSATSPKAKEIEKMAGGGIASLAVGGPVETMAAMNAVGANTGYPMAGINTAMYSNPMVQRPEAVNVISPSGDAGVNAYSGEPKFARGGISDLGVYSDGGRLLKGPGDGVSDSIPAVIGNRQPARLADGEFVVPARIVSELGNGSTEAGARKLYAMMDRVQKARSKTVGKKKVAVNTRSDKHLPA